MNENKCDTHQQTTTTKLHASDLNVSEVCLTDATRKSNITIVESLFFSIVSCFV